MLLWIAFLFLLSLLSGNVYVWTILFFGVLYFFFEPLFWTILVVLGLLLVYGLFGGASGVRTSSASSDLNANDQPARPTPKTRSERAKTRFYRPMRGARYTRWARIRAVQNSGARAEARREKASHKPKVGDQKIKEGKVYSFTESRRWKRIK